MFTCKPEIICINSINVCDKYFDCPNGDDEENCDYSFFFKCSSGEDISSNLVCNFINDCQDGSDEEKCSLFFKKKFM